MTAHVPTERIHEVLRDLDPAGDLVELSPEVRARADATFSRIVATAEPASLSPRREPGRPARPRRRLPVAAGLLGAAGVAGSALLLGGGTAFGSWTPTPEPLDGDTTLAAAASCRAALELPEGGEQVLIAERRGDWSYVLVTGSGAEAACVLPNDLIGADREGLEGRFFGHYDTDAPPAPSVPDDGLVETASMAGSIDDGWFSWSEGYVGRDVVGVTVHTPTGMDVQASVAHGRYAAWWPAGEASGHNPEVTGAPTFTVVLADGSRGEPLR